VCSDGMSVWNSPGLNRIPVSVLLLLKTVVRMIEYSVRNFALQTLKMAETLHMTASGTVSLS